jgi:putative Holliday junction resolvase
MPSAGVEGVVVGSGRVLGIDPGTKRFGLAVSDELGVTAQALETFIVAEGVDFIDHVKKLVAEYAIGEIVLGLPLSMSGNDIEGTRRSRELARRITRECRVEVILRDERMTSREAERKLGSSGGHGQRKARRGARAGGRKYEAGDIDRLAAVVLQSYLDERNG